MTKRTIRRKTSNCSKENARDEDYELKRKWSSIAENLLLDRKIVGIRYLTDEETESSGWVRSPVVLILDDGNAFLPTSDFECNEPGAICVTIDDGQSVLPAL